MGTGLDKTYEGMGWISGLYDNPHPLRLDIYSVCSFRCLYCNASFRRACSVHKGAYLRRDVRSVNPEAIRDIYTSPQGPFRRWVEQRREIQIGGLSDQFDGFEKVYGVTLEVLRFFREIDLPILFSTKSAWWIHDERYAELFRDNPKWKVRFSFGALDDEVAKELEAGAALPSEKVKAMETLAGLGGVPILRIRPLFPSGETVRKIEPLLKIVRSAGVKRVEGRVFELDGDSAPFREALPEIIRLNEMKTFRLDYPSGGHRGWERMQPHLRVMLLTKVKRIVESNGLEFSTSDRACAFENRETFVSNWKKSLEKPIFHGRWKDAAGIVLTRGRVSFQDLLPELRGVFGECRANLWKSGNLSMIQYFRRLWNDPTHPCSPQTLYPQFLYAAGAQDEEGNVVYFRKEQR